MPPKKTDNPSSSLKERETRKSHHQAKHEDLEAVKHQPATSMATTTQTRPPGNSVPMNHGTIRLPPILPVPAAMFPLGTPSSATTSPSGLNRGPTWSPGRNIPSSFRDPPDYLPPPYGTQLASSQPLSPAVHYPTQTPAQREHVRPQKRPYESRESSYG